MHSYIRKLKAIVLLMPFVFMACVDNDTDVPVTQSTVNVQMPNDVNSLDIVRDSLVYTNLTTGERLVTPRGVTTLLSQGIYDCVYGADVTYKNGNDSDAVIAKDRLTGKVENMEFTGQSKAVSMEAFLSTVNDDFISRRYSLPVRFVPLAHNIMVTAISRYIIIPTMCFMRTDLLSMNRSSSQRSFLNIIRIYARIRSLYGRAMSYQVLAPITLCSQVIQCS